MYKVNVWTLLDLFRESHYLLQLDDAVAGSTVFELDLLLGFTGFSRYQMKNAHPALL